MPEAAVTPDPSQEQPTRDSTQTAADRAAPPLSSISQVGASLIEVIQKQDGAGDGAFDNICKAASFQDLVAACKDLEDFRRGSSNLYHKVRACCFLNSIHGLYLPSNKELPACTAPVSPDAYQDLCERRFEGAIDKLLAIQEASGPNAYICSALAKVYQSLLFETLTAQVQKSVRSFPGNANVFNVKDLASYGMQIVPELTQPTLGVMPILHESIPVRMDLSHSGWSDIFFLAMDFPKGARVLNISVDLGVHGRDPQTLPPINAYLRVINEPVIKLVSVDLGEHAEIKEKEVLFDFAQDHLGLLKAAIIASGIVPPDMEKADVSLQDILGKLVGPGKGFELVSQVNDIPKGSRLAVSTNLLAALCSVCLRATGQTDTITGSLQDEDRRLMCIRALFSEWLGGSGGGWQDSGGLWPGIKLIEGVEATDSDIEFGVSNGRLLPKHTVLGKDQVGIEARVNLEKSLVLVHGGMSQNVGPLLQMVTEKHLLGLKLEGDARRDLIVNFDRILAALKAGDMKELGAATSHNFDLLQKIIPEANNPFTQQLCERVKKHFGTDFYGFWMLGGMSGGGMGFIFAPHLKAQAQTEILKIMKELKAEHEQGLPFAMQPVVYDFTINRNGTFAELRKGDKAVISQRYEDLVHPDQSSPSVVVTGGDETDIAQAEPSATVAAQLARLKSENGFDSILHEAIRRDLLSGKAGLAANRLPADAKIEDVKPDEICNMSTAAAQVVLGCKQAGEQALRDGSVATVTLAGGLGTRWEGGASLLKALSPVAVMGGRYRSFLEIHLAQTAATSRQFKVPNGVPHVMTSSFMTQAGIENVLARNDNFGYGGTVIVSPGRSIGQRLIPTVRDLEFEFKSHREQLDPQKQTLRQRGHEADVRWAQRAEANDYTSNAPENCVNPQGHLFELTNLLRNGTLGKLIAANPRLKYIQMRNLDALGATLDPHSLGFHIVNNHGISFEVTPRSIEDRGGGLAKVNGQLRLVEGLAMPNEDLELGLRYYSSNTAWITIDTFLSHLGLTRKEIVPSATFNQRKVDDAVRSLAQSLPTYITLKNVKLRWGRGHEDTLKICQYEQLLGDLTTLPGLKPGFLEVERWRAQQLKEKALIDPYRRAGFFSHIAKLCGW